MLAGNLVPGSFAEKLLIDGLDLVALGVGKCLIVGVDVILQASQIGKDGHPSMVTR